jgi:hypothetical protein
MTRGIAGVGLAVAAVMAVAVSVFAQAARYDPASELTVSGTIRYVISGVGPDGTVGVHLEVTTANGPVRVHVAPAMFIGMNNFSFLTDDTVQITGAIVNHGGDPAVWARLVVKDGKTLTLRNPDGTPRWPAATAEDPDGCGVAHALIR